MKRPARSSLPALSDPRGDLFAPLGELTFDTAVEVFFEQMTALKQGGADIAWIETMSATEEIDAAVTAAERADFDYVYTASFDTAGKTMMGLAPADLQTAAGEHKCSPVAFGANCGVGASDMLVSILAMSEASPEAVIVAKANCGVPKIKGDKVVYTGTPDLMARFARLAIDSGARIIGGCCGTTADHLAAMRQALDDYQPGSPPSTDTIVSQIGPLASPPAAPGAARNRRRSRRRAG